MMESEIRTDHRGGNGHAVIGSIVLFLWSFQ